jgi:hypothetical protein
MKFMLSAMFILSLAAACPSATLADTSMPAPSVQSTADASRTMYKKTYLDTQMSRLARWRKDIADFDDRVETKTTQAGRTAKLELASAWTSVEQASAALSTTGGDGWTAAKGTYKRAVNSLEVTWAKMDPKKK